MRTTAAVLLAGAVMLVLVVTMGGSTAPGGRINLVPGASILALNQDDKRNAVVNVLGNIALFVPIGFLGVVALRRRVAFLTALGAGFSLSIEVTQLLLGDRWVDIDDLLLNTAGTLLGAVAASATGLPDRGLRPWSARGERSWRISGTDRTRT